MPFRFQSGNERDWRASRAFFVHLLRGASIADQKTTTGSDHLQVNNGLVVARKAVCRDR